MNAPTRGAGDAVGGARPLHERVAELLRSRDAARAAAASAAAAADAECTFAPRLDANSERITAALRAAGDGPRHFIDRLAGEPSATRLAAARTAALDAADGDEQCTFAPKVSANSARIVASMDAAGRPSDFVTRQHAYAAASERKRTAAASAAGEECTFAPEVGAAAEVLARSRHAARLGETPGERDERLAVADAQRKEGLRRSLEAGLYGSYSFAPALSAGTRRLQPLPTPLEELVADTRRERARAAATAEAEALRRETCTFRPNTAPSGASARRSLGAARAMAELRERSGSAQRQRGPPSAMFASDANGAAAKIRDYALERQALAERAKAEKEAAELAACTFWPEVHHRPRARADSPVVVRGLGTFMQKQAAAARLRAEAAERERRAFILDAPERPPREAITIPRPFVEMDARLAAQRQRRGELEAKLAAEEARKHPFRPATRESANRELLRRIMGDDSEEMA